MKTIIALSSILVALFALVNCELSSELTSSEFANMPEKQWADYKVSILIFEQRNRN